MDDIAAIEARELATTRNVEAALAMPISEFVPYVLEQLSMAIAWERSERVRGKLSLEFELDPNMVAIRAEVQAHLDARAAARAMDSVRA